MLPRVFEGSGLLRTNLCACMDRRVRTPRCENRRRGRGALCRRLNDGMIPSASRVTIVAKCEQSPVSTERERVSRKTTILKPMLQNARQDWRRAASYWTRARNDCIPVGRFSPKAITFPSGTPPAVRASSTLVRALFQSEPLGTAGLVVHGKPSLSRGLKQRQPSTNTEAVRFPDGSLIPLPLSPSWTGPTIFFLRASPATAFALPQACSPRSPSSRCGCLPSLLAALRPHQACGSERNHGDPVCP